MTFPFSHNKCDMNNHFLILPTQRKLCTESENYRYLWRHCYASSQIKNAEQELEENVGQYDICPSQIMCLNTEEE